MTQLELRRRNAELTRSEASRAHAEALALQARAGESATGRAPRAVAFAFIVALLLLGIGGLIVQNEIDARALAAERIQTRMRMFETQALFSALQDVVIGQYGYALTGHERYLESYHAGVAAVERHLAALDQFDAKYFTADFEMRALRSPMANKLAEMALVIDVRRTHGMQATLEIVATGRGKAMPDALRSAIAGRMERMAGELDARVAEGEDNSRRAGPPASRC